MIFVKPLSLAYRSSGRAASSSTIGTAEGSAAGGEVFAGDREVAELRESPACRTVARIAQPDAGRRHLGTKSLEHRTHGRPRQVPVGQAQRFAADPGGDDFARIGPREAI